MIRTRMFVFALAISLWAPSVSRADVKLAEAIQSLELVTSTYVEGVTALAKVQSRSNEATRRGELEDVMVASLARVEAYLSGSAVAEAEMEIRRDLDAISRAASMREIVAMGKGASLTSHLVSLRDTLVHLRVRIAYDAIELAMKSEAFDYAGWQLRWKKAPPAGYGS